MSEAYEALKELVAAEGAIDTNDKPSLMRAARAWVVAREVIARGDTVERALAGLRDCLEQVRTALGAGFGQDMREVARCLREHSAAWQKLRAEQLPLDVRACVLGALRAWEREHGVDVEMVVGFNNRIRQAIALLSAQTEKAGG